MGKTVVFSGKKCYNRAIHFLGSKFMTEQKPLCYRPSAWRPRKKQPEPLPQELQDRLFGYILKKINNYQVAQELTESTLKELQEETDSRELQLLMTRGKKIASRKCTDYFSVRYDILMDEFHVNGSVLELLTYNDVELLPNDLSRQGEVIELLHRTIQELPEERRQPLLLRYFDKMSLVEIADTQHCSVESVLRHLKKGRKTLEKALKTYEEENGIQLNCVGVVPLLLWLSRQYRSFANIPQTDPGVAEVYFGEIPPKYKERTIVTVFKIIIGVLIVAIIACGVILVPRFFETAAQPTNPGQSTTQPGESGTQGTSVPDGTTGNGATDPNGDPVENGTVPGTEGQDPTENQGTQPGANPGPTNPAPTNPPSNPTNPPATTQPTNPSQPTDPDPSEEGPTTPIIPL